MVLVGNSRTRIHGMEVIGNMALTAASQTALEITTSTFTGSDPQHANGGVGFAIESVQDLRMHELVVNDADTAVCLLGQSLAVQFTSSMLRTTSFGLRLANNVGAVQSVAAAMAWNFVPDPWTGGTLQSDVLRFGYVELWVEPTWRDGLINQLTETTLIPALVVGLVVDGNDIAAGEFGVHLDPDTGVGALVLSNNTITGFTGVGIALMGESGRGAVRSCTTGWPASARASSRRNPSSRRKAPTWSFAATG